MGWNVTDMCFSEICCCYVFTDKADWYVLACCLSAFCSVSASCIWPRGSSGLWVRFLCCLCSISWGMILNSSLWQLICSWWAWDTPNSRRRDASYSSAKHFLSFFSLFLSYRFSVSLLSQSLQSTSCHSLATSCCCKQSRRPGEWLTLPKWQFYFVLFILCV